MASIQEKALQPDLPFGARLTGITRESLADEGVRARIREIFEDRGLIIFEEVEPSDRMLVALSNIIGTLEDISLDEVTRVEKDCLPGVLQFKNEPGNDNVFEVDGKPMGGVLTWHFDASYAGKLNRGGVLRVVENPPEGGLTGFADGIQLYKDVSPDLRAEFEGLNILYQTGLMFQHQRFGLQGGYRMIRLQEQAWKLLREVENAPRSVHPAIWQNARGEKILHAAPFQAAGIQGRENPEGDALLERLFQEIFARMTPYWHHWKTTDMAVWDNWRFIHAVSGNDPRYGRCVRRTTIKGDYGLGAMESELAC